MEKPMNFAMAMIRLAPNAAMIAFVLPSVMEESVPCARQKEARSA
jgi:hypothetical protein